MDSKRQEHSWIVIPVLLALLSACGGKGEQPSPVAPPPREVTQGEVKRQDIEIRSRVVGIIAPWRHVSVASEITGTVESLHVEMGDSVALGTPLFELDPTDAELAVEEALAQIASARATLVEAQASHDRIATISREGVASAGNLDSAVRTLGVARAAQQRAETNLNQARERLADCTVTTPITGEVTMRHIELGSPAFEVAMLNRVKLRIEVTESERVNLRRGQEVPVRVGALGDLTFMGTVYAVSAAANPQTLTFPVDIEIDNSDGRLLSGMIAHASVLIEQREDRLVVPLRSRVATLEGHGVFISDNGQAVFIPVEFGERHGEIIEVIGGLNQGDVIFVDGAESLRPGIAISVIGEN